MRSTENTSALHTASRSKYELKLLLVTVQHSHAHIHTYINTKKKPQKHVRACTDSYNFYDIVTWAFLSRASVQTTSHAGGGGGSKRTLILSSRAEIATWSPPVYILVRTWGGDTPTPISHAHTHVCIFFVSWWPITGTCMYTSSHEPVFVTGMWRTGEQEDSRWRVQQPPPPAQGVGSPAL